MSLLLSAPVEPYICDVPGNMEAMFSHVGGGAVLGPTIWTLCRAPPFILIPLAPRAQDPLPARVPYCRASFRGSVDILSPSIRCGRLPSRSDVNKNSLRTKIDFWGAASSSCICVSDSEQMLFLLAPSGHRVGCCMKLVKPVKGLGPPQGTKDLAVASNCVWPTRKPSQRKGI